MLNKTFSSMLTQILEASNMDVKNGHRFLLQNGVKVSYPVLAAYRSFDSVPALERAKAILAAFEYPIDDEELLEVLEHSRSELREMQKEKRSHISRGIRIVPGNIQKDMSVDELDEILDYRLRDLFGDAGSFNLYITKLIKEDLTGNGYVAEEQETE